MSRREDGPGTLHVEGGGDHPVEVAGSLRARSRGLLGRDGLEGALVLRPASSVHTFRMRFAIEVAFVRRDGTVSAVVRMRPQRLGLPRPRTAWVAEAEPGLFVQWGVVPGARVTVTGP